MKSLLWLMNPVKLSLQNVYDHWVNIAIEERGGGGQFTGQRKLGSYTALSIQKTNFLKIKTPGTRMVNSSLPSIFTCLDHCCIAYLIKKFKDIFKYLKI